MEKKQFKHVGKSPDRSEALEKVTGLAGYVHDMEIPGMLHGKVLNSPYARANIVSIEIGRAHL